jgi:hypothetical protein
MIGMVSASISCLGTRPSSVTAASEPRDARLELWAQALSGISQTLIAVRKSTLEHYDFNRKD